MKKVQTVFMVNLLLFGFLISEVEAKDNQFGFRDSQNNPIKNATLKDATKPPKHKNNTVEWFYVTTPPLTATLQPKPFE